MNIQIHQNNLFVSVSILAQSRKSDNLAKLHLRAQGESEPDDKKLPQFMLSKELDEEAAKYKEDNAVFKEEYENLEKVMDLLQAQIKKLQARINKLMQSQEQRFLKIEPQPEQQPAEDGVTVEHHGSKKYRDYSKIDEIEGLEKQLNELKQKEGETRVLMIKAILAERERLEELKRKNKK